MINALVLLLGLSTANAGELAGVTVPDTLSSPKGDLVLNGMGLREKWWIDVYVGALYLPSKTNNASSAITDDVHKRIVMHFVYKKVGKEKMIATFREGVEKSPKAQALTGQMAELEAMIDTDIRKGQEIILEYVPGEGTHVNFDGTERGVIAGKDFMEAIWSIFLGPTPASEDLKKGMLGG